MERSSSRDTTHRIRERLPTFYDGRTYRIRERLPTFYDGRTYLIHERLPTFYDGRTYLIHERLPTFHNDYGAICDTGTRRRYEQFPAFRCTVAILAFSIKHYWTLGGPDIIWPDHLRRRR
jgi:hypothetical protein